MKYICPECGNTVDIEFRTPHPDIIYDTHSSKHNFTVTTDNSINIACQKYSVKTIKIEERLCELICKLIQDGAKD